MSNTIEFKIKITDLSQGALKNVKASIEGVDDIVTQLTQSVNEAGTSMQKVVKTAFEWNQMRDMLSGVKDVFDGMIAPAQQFNTAMREANTMAQLGEREFRGMKDSVAELSKEIPVARDLLAKGLYQVVSNGVPDDNWITFLERSARSSVGGIADLEKVVGVTSTVIKNYGLEWSAAGDIQDKIQTTAKNGVTSFEQLADALPKVSGSAATLGVSIDELLATFATLTGVSGNTAEVSTQLSAVMNALVKPTSEAAKMAQAMGVEFNAAAIKAAGGMVPFLENLNGSVEAHAARTGMLREEIYGLLFGSAEALRAILPLTGELGGKFVENSELMVNSSGAIDEAFEQMNSTGEALSQRLSNWVAGFSDFAYSVIGSATPLITFAAQAGIAITQMTALWKVLRAVSFKGLIAGLAGSKVALLAKSAATAVATVASKAYSVSLKALTVALGSARLAVVALWSALTLGVGLLIWGIVEAISALTGAVDKNEETISDAQAAHKSYQEALAGVRSEMKVLISEVKNFSGSKDEEARKVAELNSKYGETFGNYKTLADWYDALISKSELYCQMIANEAKIRALADNSVKAEQNLKSIESAPESEFYKPAENIDYSGRGDLLTNIIVTAFSDLTLKTSETTGKQGKELAKEQAQQLISDYNSEMDRLAKENAKIQKELTVGVVNPKVTGGDGGKDDATPVGELEKVAAKIKEFNALRQKATSPEQIATLKSQIIELEAEQKRLNDLTLERYTLLQNTASMPSLNVPPLDKPELKTEQPNLKLPQLTNPLEAKLKIKLQGVERAREEINRLKELLTVAKPGESEVIQQQIDGWTQYTDAMENNVQTGEKSQAILGGLGQIMGTMSGVVGEGAGAWIGYAANVIQSIAQLIPALVAVSMANTIAGSTGSGPFGWITLGVSLASVIAAIASIPKFADGGIAYGPTLGLFGEYAGAANNPEVVAPLNKLRSLIQPQGDGVGGVVEFRIEGRNLVGVLNKQHKFNSRTNG